MVRDLFNSAVYVELYGQVKSFVLSNSGKEEDVRDTLQEGLFIFFKKDSDEDIILDTKLSLYILGICKKVWFKELKKKQRIVLSQSFDDVEEGFDEELYNKERIEALFSILRRCISKLSTKSQEAIGMRLEGLSCKDIAEILNFKNAGIVSNKTRLSRLRLKNLVQQDPEYIQLFS